MTPHSNHDDPLESLVLDDQELARGDLAYALKAFVRFTKAGEIILEPAFDSLSTREKVCCVLLSYRALHMLGLREEASVRSSEIESGTGMPGGTVRPKLSELKNNRIAVQRGKEWTIAVHALRRAIAAIGSTT